METKISGKSLSVLFGAAFLWASATAEAGSISSGTPLPEFTHHTAADWLNSEPLSVAKLRGSVVLIDFWAYECWNCFQTIPWLQDVEARYARQGLVVISVHTPELEKERVRDNVADAVQRYHLTNPVMLDNDYSYWDALETQAWPTFYIADRNGKLRLAAAGEVHIGDNNAKQIEAAIERLLAEKADSP